MFNVHSRLCKNEGFILISAAKNGVFGGRRENYTMCRTFHLLLHRYSVLAALSLAWMQRGSLESQRRNKKERERKVKWHDIATSHKMIHITLNRQTAQHGHSTPSYSLRKLWQPLKMGKKWPQTQKGYTKSGCIKVIYKHTTHCSVVISAAFCIYKNVAVQSGNMKSSVFIM